MPWSTQSKAAERSSRPSNVTSRTSADVSMSDQTQSIAVSVKCFRLYADWWRGRTGHRRTLFFLPENISLFITGIIWNNSLVGGRIKAEVWTPTPKHVTLYCTRHPSAWTTGLHGRVLGGRYHCAKFGRNHCSSCDNMLVLMFWKSGLKNAYLCSFWIFLGNLTPKIWRCIKQTPERYILARKYVTWRTDRQMVRPLLMPKRPKTRCRPNGTKRYWPAMKCYRWRQTPDSITSLAPPPTLCVDGPV